MTDAGSLRGRLLLWLALLLLLVLLASGLSAYWNGREVADTAYDRTLLASARAIADGLYEKDGTLRADVPYVALDTFAYDSAGRIFYQVNDIHGRMISGYENLPAAPADTLRTDDYPALAKFYDGVYQGVDVRVVSLLQPVSEPSMSGMAEIRVAETEGARERMARSLMTDTLLRLGVLGVGALVLVWLAVSAALRPLDRLRREVEERQPDDLREHNCLLYQLGGRVHDRWAFQRGRRSLTLTVAGDRVCDDADVVRRWALAGKGLVYKSWLDVAEDVRAGRLRLLLPEWQGEATPMNLLCTHRAQLTRPVTLLRAFVRERCDALLAEAPWTRN